MVFQDTLKSLPVWEEWIEMPLTCGRGLISKSLPVWEEWIEIMISRQPTTGRRSLPVWEEWIEIGGAKKPLPMQAGLFPYGKSGLKCRQARQRREEARVSSRMGRVD